MYRKEKKKDYYNISLCVNGRKTEWRAWMQIIHNTLNTENNVHVLEDTI